MYTRRITAKGPCARSPRRQWPPGDLSRLRIGRGQTVAELREIALLLAADIVDRQLEDYLKQHGITGSYGAQERILMCMTPRSSAQSMIASGRHIAERFHGELIAVHVRQSSLEPTAQI